MIDETLLEAEEKMEKAVSRRQGRLRLDPHRPRQPVDVQQDRGRLLRRADAGEPAGVVPRPRAADGSSSRRTTRRSMAAIEKAIRDTDLGVNPTNDGAIIRVVFPQLTEERRKEFIKVARTRPRTPRSRSATSAGTPRTSSTGWPRTARPARTRSTAPRRSSRRSPHKYVAADRRAAQAQGGRAARGLRLGSPDAPPMTTDPERRQLPARARSRCRRCRRRSDAPAPGATCPAAIGVGLGLGAVVLRRAVPSGRPRSSRRRGRGRRRSRSGS